MEGKIEELILLVKEKPELYDMSNENYSNLLRKENICKKYQGKLMKAVSIAFNIFYTQTADRYCFTNK